MDTELKDRFDYYKDQLYNLVRIQQTEDETYYRDTFEVPWIKKPLIVSRTGAGAELIDNPVAQLTSSVLKVTRPPVKDTAGAKNSAISLTSYLNYAIAQIMKQNPNLKLEHYKNQLLRGEAWIQILHDQNWAEGKRGKGLPFRFLTRDPMVIFASPNEDEDGVPDEVFVYYERMPWKVKSLYTNWSNPEHRGEDNKTNVNWMEHWTPTERYFEADGEAVLPDDKNPYGLVPFVHKIASFGKSSDAGRMEDLIVGRLRRYRDLLKRDAASTSDIDSIIHIYADPVLNLLHTQPDIETPKDFRENFVFGAGHINEIPFGIDVKRGVDMLPSTEVLQWNYKIAADLGRKVPGALLGMPSGASGRLQDMTYGAALGAYSVETANLENAVATAFGIALRIMAEWPDNLLIPDDIKHEDIGGNYDVVVELTNEDPIDRDRKIMAGRTMVTAGLISKRTFLIKYVGMTEDEAEEEIEETLAEAYMFQSPDIAELMQVRAAEKSGMAGDVQALKERRQALEKKVRQFPLGAQIGSQGGEQRMGNIQTEQGQNEADISNTQGGIRSTAMR